MTTKTRTKRAEPSLDEATAFAQRHGLSTLRPEYIERLRTLIAPVAQFGQQVRRSPNKDDAPATNSAAFKR